MKLYIWHEDKGTSKDYYLPISIDISACRMAAMVRLKTGTIGPLWEDEREMLEHYKEAGNYTIAKRRKTSGKKN